MTSQLTVAAFGAAPQLRPFNRLLKLIPKSGCCIYTTDAFCNYAAMNSRVILKFLVASAIRTTNIRSMGSEKCREFLSYRMA
jgi:hypothetical protein